MDVIIRKFGAVCDVSPDGYNPLPPELSALLTPHMTYNHKRTLRGAEAYDYEGTRHNVDIEARKLYKFEYGRLTTGAGYIQRIVNVLSAAGHVCRLMDLEAGTEHPRPRRYETDWDSVHAHFTFRPRQEDILRAIERNPGGIIDVTMGVGKTHLAAPISFLYPFAKIHVVVRQIDVLNRMMRGLVQHIPNVGQIGGNSRRMGDRVTVFSADSLEWSDGDADILLCDEVHGLMADKYANTLATVYQRSRNYGLSGTAYARSDGAHARLECLFGPTIIHIPYQEAMALGLVVPIRVRWVPVVLEHNPAKDRVDTARKRWGIWRNDARNQIIADTANEYGNDQVLILVESIEHAVYLGARLPNYALCYGKMDPEDCARHIKNGLLPADYRPINAKQRQLMQEDFISGRLRKVIATDVWSTGVDFQELSVLIRADERESVIKSSQGSARVSRIAEGKEYGLVIDFIDHFDSTLMNKSRVRRSVYRSMGWTQVNWPDGRRNISRG